MLTDIHELRAAWANARAIIFDEAWYRGGGPPFSGDADAHFSTIGWREGRNPSPLFDVAHYLKQVPALVYGDMDPVQHYLEIGVGDGIDPHPLFDTKFYVKRNYEEMKDENPLTHYLVEGYVFACDPSPFFDTAFYLEKYADVAEGGTNPLVHFAIFGGNELARKPNPSFDPKSYAYRRELPKGLNPLLDLRRRLDDLRTRIHVRVEDPLVSVIVLNLNKSALTIECVLELLDDEDPIPHEIIVVDNGSHSDEFARLTEWLPTSVRLVRLMTNRFFGEGNNIGAEAARGKYLLFLNNDAFVGRKTISRLVDVFARFPDVGAVGPKFVYPDGSIQEAGATVSSCGTVTQRGKYLDDLPSRFPTTEPVDYVSAACVVLARADFEAIGGFDLVWDPAYYEDVDLCLKLELLGKRTYFCPEAVVAHIENATSSDPSHGLRLSTVVRVNREKFIARWGSYIERRHDPSAVRVSLPSALREPPAASAGVAIVFTPYQLIPGGGERYLLCVAQWLSKRYRTYVVTTERYSSYRLRGLAAELELDLSQVRLAPLSDLHAFADCDVFVAMGNEAIPAIAPVGRKKLYICQFPFRMHSGTLARAWGHLESYDDVIVYSTYAERYFRERAGALTTHEARVTVLPPAVPIYADALAGKRVPGKIVNVGRFHPSGHCKRQDVLVDAFRLLLERTGRTDLELHLAGTVSPEAMSREFYLDVHERARGLPVQFHLNALPEDVRDLYATSSFYWHGTGFGQSELLFPERMEHFGITVVEAMSSGAIPLVYGKGGPAEIVADGTTGYHWRTIEDLVAIQARVLERSEDENDDMRLRGHVASLAYDTAAFEDRLSRIVYGNERLDPRTESFVTVENDGRH